MTKSKVLVNVNPTATTPSIPKALLAFVFTDFPPTIPAGSVGYVKVAACKNGKVDLVLDQMVKCTIPAPTEKEMLAAIKAPDAQLFFSDEGTLIAVMHTEVKMAKPSGGTTGSRRSAELAAHQARRQMFGSKA